MKVPKLLGIDDLRAELHADYAVSVNADSKKKRGENIEVFLKIDRSGLQYEKIEKRLHMYSTLMNEKICIQYPGKESKEELQKPYDFRPKIIMDDGEVMPDASFGVIWDILDKIAQKHNDYLKFVATIFWHIGYMYGYEKTVEICDCELVYTDKRKKNRETIKPGGTVKVEWWHMNIGESVWRSLNNYIGLIAIDEKHEISFEALMKYVDLLLQNEDCKYYYIKKIVNKEAYQLKNGRTNTADANMDIIMYFEKKCSFSEIANKIQKGRGMPHFKKENYHLVTDEIISNVK
jgi:hypothetical protein